MKNIIIFGGGISGLTAAHELIELNYDVTIIERNDIVGGLARTYGDEKKKICPYEHSWRAYGRWYQNVYDLMKRIPFNNNETVFDKLVVLNGGEKTCNKEIPSYEETFSNISFFDKIKIYKELINYYTSCSERNRKDYSEIGLRKYILENGVDKETENKIGKIVGPYLGFDYHNASLYDSLYCFEMITNNSDEENTFNITSLPTNYCWFDPWLKYLISKGLNIKLNNEVKSLNINNNNEITSINVYDKINKITNELKSDYYINCTGPEVLTQLLMPYRLYPSIKPFLNDIKTVAQNGRQIQLSIYYYLDKKVFLSNKNTLAYLPNTPWLLMVLPTGHIWGDEHLSKFCKKEIKEIISVGICEPYVDGLKIKKPWSKCTVDEIREEAWYQLINDNDFKNNNCIEDNLDLKNVNIIDFKMWDSYKFKDGKIDTYEPKWANNINTILYRPKPKTPINNLFVGGAYSDTTTGVYSMESAAESGKIAAKELCKYDKKEENIYLFKKEPNKFTILIRSIDYFLYKNNLPKFITFLIILILILLLSSFILYKLSNFFYARMPFFYNSNKQQFKKRKK
jgi:hypothetical protein